jgi:hypothetical protein
VVLPHVRPVPSEECLLCGGPMPKVLYGYPNFSSQSLNKKLSEGSVVLGGCITGRATRRSCPRCGWST